MANRIRGILSNARALSYFVVRIAVALLGNGAARRVLESPTWGETASPPEGPILNVEAQELELPGCPFDALPSSDGSYVFVSLHRPGGSQRTPGTIAILRRSSDELTVLREVQLPAAPWGLAFIRNERFLVVANSHGVALIDTDAARHSGRDPVVSTAHYGRDLQTIRVQPSMDETRLFATDEHNRTVSILDLTEVESGRLSSDSLLTQIPVDLSPLGLAVSADGKYLYTTCEMSRIAAPDLVNWFVWGATLQGHLRRAGILTAIDVAAAIDDPGNAIVSESVAGGHPVRIQRSRTGDLAWVTARASNQLLAFDITQSDSPTLIATAPVGPAPVGLAVLDELGVVLVANSNRFESTGRRERVSVIDINRVLAQQPALLGYIEVGSFPREINVDRNHGIVYVTNFDSKSLSMITTESISREIARIRAGSIGGAN